VSSVSPVASPARPVGLENGIEAALAEGAAIGSTARQIAARVDRPLDDVEATLRRWEAEGRAQRIGRGLWTLAEYSGLLERDDFESPRAFAERFERETGVALGRYLGPITFSDNEEEPVHRWWPYVQGFSAGFVRRLLLEFEPPSRRAVARALDPFAGSGTTLVEARRAGWSAVGAELLPPAALAARVKTRFELDPAALRSAAEACVARSREIEPGPPPFLRETNRHFSRAVRLELQRLRDALPPGSGAVSEAVRVAFGRILIPVSRLTRSPCLGYKGKTGARAGETVERFLAAVATMEADLRSLRDGASRWGPRAHVVEADARTLALPPGSVDLAVTSPPYVNGMDYVNNYKLDLAWLGYARAYADLVSLRERLVACDNLPRVRPGGTVEVLPSAETLDPWLPEMLARIRANLDRKGNYRRSDVDRIVLRYFADLDPVLSVVSRALAPGGRFVVVVGDSLLAGTYVPGDLLLARMGIARGLRLRSVDVARTRRSGQRRSFALRESVVCLEKPRAG
jgi:hypothetical protein